MTNSVLRHALWPWWTLQLATGAKSFVDNPVIGSQRLNEAGLHVARLRLAYQMAWSRRRRLAKLIRPEDRTAFDRDGFVARTDFLSGDVFARLRDQVERFRGEAREMMQGDAITRRIALDPEALAAIPEAAAVLNNADWRGLNRYVGTYDSEPMCSIQTILARQGTGVEDPQLSLHADTFHPTVKAWFFLTDVTLDDGPLTYVPGSHLLTEKRIEWERRTSLGARDAEQLTARGSFRIRREELASLGLPEPHSFAVPANTLVVADTFGFHARGPANHASRRVEIWSYGRRNPYVPWTGMDLMSLSWIARRRVTLRWRLRDRYARWIGQPWTAVGRKSAFDCDSIGL